MSSAFSLWWPLCALSFGGGIALLGRSERSMVPLFLLVGIMPFITELVGATSASVALVPKIWAGTLLLSTAIWAIQLWRTPPRPQPLEGRASTTHRPLITVAIVAIALWSTPHLGYLATWLVAIPVLSRFFGYRRWVVIITVTVAWLLFSYGVFELFLGVPLPAGRWSWR